MMLFLSTIQLLILTFIQIQTTSADAVGDLQTKGRAALDAQLAKSTTCTSGKLMVRKEW
jgi:tyrosinase